MTLFVHLIDIIPFVLATIVILWGSGKISQAPLQNSVIIVATFLYLVAQSSWFSSWLAGNEWGRDIANFIWFFFNTTTMVIFIWVLYKSKEK